MQCVRLFIEWLGGLQAGFALSGQISDACTAELSSPVVPVLHEIACNEKLHERLVYMHV